MLGRVRIVVQRRGIGTARSASDAAAVVRGGAGGEVERGCVGAAWNVDVIRGAQSSHGERGIVVR